MGERRYATGRSREDAAKRRRTQPRVVVTMSEPKKKKVSRATRAAQAATREAIEEAADQQQRKAAPKKSPSPLRSEGSQQIRKPHGRTIPKNVTQKPKPKPQTRKVPQRKPKSETPPSLPDTLSGRERDLVRRLMRAGEYLVPSTRIAKKGAEAVKKYLEKKKAREEKAKNAKKDKKEKTSKEKTRERKERLKKIPGTGLLPASERLPTGQTERHRPRTGSLRGKKK